MPENIGPGLTKTVLYGTIWSMYIRRTTVKSRKDGKQYYSYRLVESQRTDQGVRQYTLLNLGVDFSLPKEQWPVLTARIKDILGRQSSLVSLPTTLEAMAQKYAASIINLQKQEDNSSGDEPDFREVDLNTLDMQRPRSVGCEHVALETLKNLELDKKLIELGFNGPDSAAALGTIIGRICHPGSEKATLEWLRNKSGLGELINYDYDNISLDRMYRIADRLYSCQDEIEKHLYQREKKLFGFRETITLYDLTNTYFEGSCLANDLAQRGHSKEKRTDCPLVILALVLDSSGFPKTSRVFKGNTSEPKTLQEIIDALDKGGASAFFLPLKPTIVMDAGIATQANIDWLKEKGYPYLVVSRNRHRQFDDEHAVVVKEDNTSTVRVQKVIDPETGETLLYCHSSQKEKKERAISERFRTRFEAALRKLDQGLDKKGCLKKYDKVVESIGRLKQQNQRVASHFRITVEKDAKTGNATRITWKHDPQAERKATLPGVYCLRTSQHDWDAETLWRTYTMITDIEAVFRSLKSELGLRPVFHQTATRVSGHLFITLIAYHIVHSVRYQLKIKGINNSFETLRERLSGQTRVTISLRCKNEEMIFVRKSSRPEPLQQEIYDALGLPHYPGTTTKTTMDQK